jgi:hypothetical protein
MLTLAGILILMALNRVRGLDTPLPGRSLYFVAPLVGLVAWGLLGASAWTSGAFALSYLVWGAPAWGRWFDLGRLPEGYARTEEPKGVEGFVDRLGSDHFSFAVRQLMVFPGLALVAYLTGSWAPVLWVPVFAGMAVMLYELAWRFVPRYPIPVAEVLVGGLWAATILAL